MSTISKLAALAFAGAALAGCTSVLYEHPDTGPAAGAAATPSKGKRAGIISTLGERPVSVHVAADSGPNTQELEPTQDWQTDFFAETVVERWATSRGLETVVAGTEGRKPFASLAGFKGAAATDLLDISSARAAMESFAQRERLDLLVVVTPARMPSQYSGPLDVYTGYGLWNRGTLSGCFANVRITVIDARTGKVVKQEQSSRMSRRENSALAGRHLANLSEMLRMEMRDCALDAINSATDTILYRLAL